MHGSTNTLPTHRNLMSDKVITTRVYDAPCGRLALGSFGGSLCMCDWLTGQRHDLIARRLARNLGACFAEGTSPLLETAVAQLDEYFSGRRRVFDLPLLFTGTEFQKAVWQRLMTIPYGETISYGAMASGLGMPKAVRAVANANGANAISIFAPCHRVIGADRSLTGYGGGLAVKRYLLDLERNGLS